MRRGVFSSRIIGNSGCSSWTDKPINGVVLARAIVFVFAWRADDIDDDDIIG